MRMPALLPHTRPRWIWPTSLVTATVILVIAVLLPRSWWVFLWPSASPRHLARPLPDADPSPRNWVIVLPPPVIVATAEPPDAPAATDRDPAWLPADWWSSAWQDGVVVGREPHLPALPDSLLPAPLVALLGTQATVALILSAPDSAIEATIWRLEQTTRLTRDDRAGFYTAIARARAYADLKSREAAMYGEFLFDTVPVPR